MSWSLSLGRIAGIRIYIHFTFFILLAWVAFSSAISTGRWEGAIGGLILFSCLAAIVVLHELGHAFAAKLYGIRTRDITLLPIGGVARLERMPEKPTAELVVAIAGPAVNVVLAAILGLVLLGSGIDDWRDVLRGEGGLLSQLLWINVSLALFNMLPAFPMDGGRVLRALLAMAMDYVEATRVAAYVGQGMAILFAIGGLLFNPMLLLIALFVWTGAEAEAGMVRTRAVLAGVPVSRLMATHFHTLTPRDTIGQAADFVARGFQQDFPVVEFGELVGMLTRKDLMAALAAQPPDSTVEGVMRTNFETVHPRDTIETAISQFQTCDCSALPVIDDGDLVGILTIDMIGEYLAIRERTGRPPAADDRGADFRHAAPPRRVPIREQSSADQF